MFIKFRALTLKYNNSVVRRIFIHFIITSLFVGGIAGALLFTWTYQQQSQRHQERSDDIRNSYIGPVAHAVWQYDREQLKYILTGIQARGDVNYARASDHSSLSVEVGIRPYHTKVTLIPLDYEGNSIGTLELSIDESVVLRNSVVNAIPYLTSLLIVLFSLAVTLVLVVYRIVTQRVTTLARGIESQLKHGIHDSIPVQVSQHGDEIDQLQIAFNNLNEQLLDELLRNKRTQQQLSVINAELEERVEERTQHLSETIQRLNQTLDDLNATQGQLIESEKLSALGGMIAAIGHEIETPFGLCLTMESCLRNDLKDLKQSLGADLSEESTQQIHAVSESLDMLKQNLRRASELMKSFKEVSAGQIGNDSEWINIKDTISELVYSLTPTLRHTQHQVTIDCPDNISIQASASAINQILTNLIMNSLNHGFVNIEEGVITIKVGEDRDNIVMLYTDNGVGLSDEAQIKIFEPLFTTKRGKGGTGLGMHLVYNIVHHRMKGDITLEKTKEGVAFRVAIPKRKAQRRNKSRNAIY